MEEKLERIVNFLRAYQGNAKDVLSFPDGCERFTREVKSDLEFFVAESKKLAALIDNSAVEHATEFVALMIEFRAAICDVEISRVKVKKTERNMLFDCRIMNKKVRENAIRLVRVKVNTASGLNTIEINLHEIWAERLKNWAMISGFRYFLLALVADKSDVALKIFCVLFKESVKKLVKDFCQNDEHDMDEMFFLR